MKHHSVLLTTAVVAILACHTHAAVSLTKHTADGKTGYRLDNGRVSLVVGPSQGGAVISYKDKLGGDVEIVSDQRPRGLCVDHVQSQLFPGEMFYAAYEVIAQKRDPQVCVLTLRYVLTGHWGSHEDEKLAGLVLDKTYTLRAPSPALECRIRITAPKKGSKLFAYWQQNLFFPGGQCDRGTDKTFRPTARGVRVKSKDHTGHTGPEAFLRDMTAGWMALVDTQRKTGLVSLSDYNELDALYCCKNFTLEPMFRVTYLPAKQSVEYVTYLVPVVGLDNVVSATADYIAGYRVTSTGKGAGTLHVSAIRSVNAPAALAMKVSLVSVPDPSRVTAVGTASFGALGDAVQTRTLAFTGAGEDPLVLKVETTAKDASGKAVAGRFEEYVNGTYKWGENLQTDMATPVYRGERPKQKLSLHKPTPLKLKYMPCTQIWYAEGLLDDGFNVATAVHMTQQDTTPEGGRTRRDRAFTCFSSNWLTRLSSFPYDYDKLLSYDMIVLGGVKAEALGLIGQEMLCDFLTAGGGMIVLGGPAAYGPSRLRGTPLADMLPVTIAPTPFDLAKLRDATVKPVAPDTPFLEALDWSDAPRVRYVHKVGVKPWGKVVLEAGGHPFLVVGEVGPRKARVACIMGVPMGSFAENATPFWEWADWTYLLRQLNWWVMKENHRFKPDVW